MTRFEQLETVKESILL